VKNAVAPARLASGSQTPYTAVQSLSLKDYLLHSSYDGLGCLTNLGDLFVTDTTGKFM